MQIQLLELRKNEKDFLSRKDLKYLDNFQKNIKNFENIKTILDDEFSKSNIDPTELNNYKNVIAEYSTIFTKIVNLQKEIGLNPDSGLYGALRDSVHLVQEFAKKSNDNYLLATVYDLRKQEKDFMLRKDLKYVETFKSVIEVLISDINNSSNKENLNNYKNA